MAKKNRPQNTDIEKGIYRIKEAAKNPAIRKMFDAIISGAIDDSIVDKSYLNVEIDFEGNEVDCVCRILTREKIHAFQNDVNRSASTLAQQFIEALNINDQYSDTVTNIVNAVGDTFEEENDEVRRITVMAIIRNTLLNALDTRTVVKASANESAVVDVVDASALNDETAPAEDVPGAKLVEKFVDLINDEEVAKECVTLAKSLAENPDNEAVSSSLKEAIMSRLSPEVKTILGLNDDVVQIVEDNHVEPANANITAIIPVNTTNKNSGKTDRVKVLATHINYDAVFGCIRDELSAIAARMMATC